MSLSKDASKNIADRLAWHTANRDQAGIANGLAEGKDIPEVYGLGEAGLFDEFFYFLDQFGFTSLFMKLEPKCQKRNSPVPFMRIIYVYLMRIVAGLPFFWHMDSVILRSQSLMRLVGFNGRDIKEGTCMRGKKKDQDDEPTQIRGPVSCDYIRDKLADIVTANLENLFNRGISILAANNFFPKTVHALLDASLIESTEKCKGCGKVTKEKPPELRLRKNRIRKVIETVFGFKIWVVWDPNSRLPLAMQFTTIEVHDINMAKQVVQQAIDNLGGHGRIASLAIDRGFMDGAFLWWLNNENISFFIPAKTNMDVYNDALSFAGKGYRTTRKKIRSVGAGKNKSTVTDTWDVEALEGLTSSEFYGPLGSGSHQNSKRFAANPINAVVVWHDPYKANNPDSNTMVILTNGSVDDPIAVYDRYDARSEIENALFREAKQAWFIERPPVNTRSGFFVHVYLSIFVMALTTAFKDWMDQQDKLEKKGQDTGIRKFREKVKEENGNKLIIFDEDRYAIFDAYEVFILCGRNVLRPTGVAEKITREDILIKYGAQLE
jgi:hypothetical protein